MMTKRREFSPKVKGQAFARADGRCEKCTAYLIAGKYHYDHVTADALGGKPTLANCEVLCTNCHSEKTRKQDVPRIAKKNRQHLKHIGAKAPSKRPIPGSKASRWKKRMDGTVERRNSAAER